MIFEITGILCLIFAFICFGIMDKLAHHYTSLNFKLFKNNPNFWNKEISWKNKYKNFPDDRSERFPFSKTVFVFLTDGWHLMQFIAYNFIALGATLLMQKDLLDSIIIFICLRIITTFYKAFTMKAL